MSNLEKALKYLYPNEGGYTNDPDDPGGATNFGITIGDLSRHRGHIVTPNDVKNMTRDEAAEIYKEKYWKPLGCNLIEHDGIATAIFDMGVLRGIGVPPKYAQLICNRYGNKLTVDGKIGPYTASAINKMDPKVFIKDFEAMCASGFRDIVVRKPRLGKYLKGWLNRSRRLLTLA